MPNASLIVRLFDASSDTPSKPPLPSPTPAPRTRIPMVAEILYATYDNPVVVKAVARRKVPELPMWDSIGGDIEMGRLVEDCDWQVLRPQLTMWMHSAFPPCLEMRHTLDLKYALKYADSDMEAGTVGGEILAGVDMLFNMPMPNRAMTRPNTVIGYKTHFAYLRAKRDPLPESPEVDNPKYVIDDVSRYWDFDASTVRCPVYVDDFTSVSGMDLGPDACLLVLVTQVDVTFTSESSYDLKMPFRHPGRLQLQ